MSGSSSSGPFSRSDSRTHSDAPFAFNIDVPVRTEWRNVTLLVTSVQNCFNAMFADVDGSQMIAMVTGELLENAIKYGAWSANQSDHLFRLSIAGKDRHARVLVENPADEANIVELLATLKWIKTFATPHEAYCAKLLEIAQTPPDVDVSKLGLVRVAYEASCQIDAEVHDGVVRVTADMKL